MNAITNRPSRELAPVIEPVASYVCAADHPRETLRRVIEALLAEVKLTNDAALRHWATASQRSFELAL
jgi:hypothetical protein